MGGSVRGSDYAKTLPAAGPFGFFDPLGFTSDLEPGTVRYYREVEVKHGRVAMLGALGFVVGESFHPLFGGNIDVPSYVAFQQTPLQTFWPAVVFVIASLEVFSVFTFEDPNVEGWAIRADHEPGTLGSNNRRWDPLGLAPSDPAEFKA